MTDQPDQDSPTGIAVLGTKTIALRLVEGLAAARLGPSQVVTWDDSSDVRSRLDDLASTCSRLAVPFTAARKTDEAYAALRRSGPAVVLVAGWYRLIPDEVLESVPVGFVGAHYSPLPAYRGSAPVVWQLLNGEPELGFSLFRLGSGMDEGLLGGGGRVPAGDGYVGAALDRLDAAALDELVRIAPGLAEGTHPFVEQPNRRPSYASMRTPADGRIDWTRPASEIVRAVRAQSRPYPGAWSMHRETEVRLWRASVEDSADYFGVPGHVVRLLGDSPVIACGSGGVLLEEFDGPRLSLACRLE
jgi:methionyl-tRNA formyltransferase